MDTPTIETREEVMFFDTDCGGVVHNIAYLRSVLAHEGFAAGSVYTRFLADHHQALLAAAAVPHG